MILVTILTHFWVNVNPVSLSATYENQVKFTLKLLIRRWFVWKFACLSLSILSLFLPLPHYSLFISSLSFTSSLTMSVSHTPGFSVYPSFYCYSPDFLFFSVLLSVHLALLLFFLLIFPCPLFLSLRLPVFLSCCIFLFVSPAWPSVSLRSVSLSNFAFLCVSSWSLSLLSSTRFSLSLHNARTLSLYLKLFYYPFTLFLHLSVFLYLPFRLSLFGIEPCPRAGCVPTRCILQETINK